MPKTGFDLKIFVGVILKYEVDVNVKIVVEDNLGVDNTEGVMVRLEVWMLVCGVVELITVRGVDCLFVKQDDNIKYANAIRNIEKI